MAEFFHYTCDHGHAGIRADGSLRGSPHPLMRLAGPIIWLTDMDVPDRAALGLTMQMLTCDRTAYRFTVDTARAVHWPRAARQLISPSGRLSLDLAPGARPMHWWVVVGPDRVPVLAEKSDR